MSTTRIPVIYGAAGIGAPKTFCKLTDPAAAQPVVDAYCKASTGTLAIDTSNLYGFGSSEAILGQMNLHGAVIDTKSYPMEAGGHSAAKLKEAIEKAVSVLKGNKIRVFYLHAPDMSVPFEESIKVMDEYHKKGAFELFGLSNYKTYQVAEIVALCRTKGYVMPTVYEGLYSAIDRTIETEMVPCLRRHNIKLAAYCPLAGGFLVGHLLESDNLIEKPEPGSHFDATQPFGEFYSGRYGPMVGPVKELKAIVEKNGLNLNQASVRWLQHHSALIPSDLGIIYGGSKPSHVETTLKYNAEGPLPEEVAKAFEETYAKVKGGLPNYHHDPAWYDPKVYGY